MANPVRVVVADDHPLFLDALRMFLHGRAGVEVVGAVPNGAEAIDVALLREADVVLMDVMMPVMDGVEATKRLLALRPSARVILVSGRDSAELAALAQEVGAVGCLAKDRIHEHVVAAVLSAASA